jgi:hypothetical protein
MQTGSLQKTMNNQNKQDNLKKRQQLEQLKKWEGLARIAQSEDYLNHLKPLLSDAFNNKWLDPASSTNYQDFHKQYTELYGRAMAYQELYNTLENSKAMVVKVSEQVNSKEGGPSKYEL